MSTYDVTCHHGRTAIAVEMIEILKQGINDETIVSLKEAMSRFKSIAGRYTDEDFMVILDVDYLCMMWDLTKSFERFINDIYGK